jgi:excisionase family DNA binding protein
MEDDSACGKPLGISGIDAMALLTPEQAASELGISDRQLRDLSSDGAIPFINVGRGNRPARRYEPSDIEAFKAERRRSSCQSTNAPARKRTATTSSSRVLDIQEILAARQSEKRRNSKNANGKRPNQR